MTVKRTEDVSAELEPSCMSIGPGSTVLFICASKMDSRLRILVSGFRAFLRPGPGAMIENMQKTHIAVFFIGSPS